MAGLLVALATASCGDTDHGIIDVQVRVSVCADGGQRCFGLAVVEADVTVTTVDGRVVASGKTDDAGRVSFQVDQSGTLPVVVRSPLLETGEVTGMANVSPGGGSSVSFMVPMSPDLITAAGAWTSS